MEILCKIAIDPAVWGVEKLCTGLLSQHFPVVPLKCCARKHCRKHFIECARYAWSWAGVLERSLLSRIVPSSHSRIAQQAKASS